MPVRFVTPSRAAFILITAAFVSMVNLVIFTQQNSNFHSNGFSLADDLFLEKLLHEPVEQDHPAILKWVGEKLVKPSKEPYNLEYVMSGLLQERTLGKEKVFSPSQEFIIDQVEELFGDQIQTGGTFLEAGAFDGEFLSNTLALEYEYKWEGILVEANPIFFKKLLTKNRKAWAINACLNTKPWPSREIFVQLSADNETNHLVNSNDRNQAIEENISRGSSGLQHFVEKADSTSKMHNKFPVQCIPIYTIIRSLGLSHIDFLSLDVEGAEMRIFDTIPWDKLSFTIIAVEHQTLDDIREYLRKKGYIHMKSFHIDHIFVNKELTTFRSKDPAPSQNNQSVEATVTARNPNLEKVKFGVPPDRPKHNNSSPMFFRKIRQSNKL